MNEDSANRTQILATALRLFSERGYEGVGVAELCEASGITKPTLYHYFGSKRGLLDAILSERGGPLLAALRSASAYAAGDRESGVPDGLRRMAAAFAEAARGDGDFARLRLSLSFAPPASEGGMAAAALNEEVFALAEAFFRAAAGDHGNMRGRSRPYAASFIGAVDTCVGLFLAGRSPLAEEEVRAAVRQFMYGIFS
jgi:AcrR family transcriptional regulator